MEMKHFEEIKKLEAVSMPMKTRVDANLQTNVGMTIAMLEPEDEDEEFWESQEVQVALDQASRKKTKFEASSTSGGHIFRDLSNCPITIVNISDCTAGMNYLANLNLQMKNARF
ncbi:unnamed protein product [Calypogeia fissa]